MKSSDNDKRKLHTLRLIAFLPLFLISAAVLLNGCAKNTEPTSRTGFYFDTVIQITLYDTEDETLLDGCFALAEKYENLFSATKEGSDVWNINHGNGETVTVSEETVLLLAQAADYANKTESRIDPTIRPLSELWHFGSEEAHVPEERAIKEALSHVSCDTLRFGTAPSDTTGESAYRTVTLTDPEAAVDLGFIAKGYIADKMRDYLLSQNVHSACISLGGNVLVIGEKPDGSPFRIGIQEPFAETGKTLDTMELCDTSAVTSGIYERCFYENDVLYHHVLDTATGYPVENELAAVTVICPSSMKADALSTSCLCLGLDEGQKLLDAEEDVAYLLITKDGTQYRSKNFP
ncbi:MAG: FAD:protein FMN transferase [Bacteroidales bacterium]|nr:FAD:protein FMN transferase [Bacteroidales bacterium]MCM1414369.1 FAD:protein FMN transferase [bacterium]MCM1424937.1 FAD:protein FMN transferase [bacterium]